MVRSSFNLYKRFLLNSFHSTLFFFVRDNTVSACKKCNGRKSSLLPSELKRVGMRLLREPKVPSMYELNQSAGRILLPRNVHPTWAPYLGLDINWNTKMRPRGGKSSTNEKESSI